MKQYQFLLLDLDGTLYDFDKAEDKALTDLIASWGLPACSQKDIDAYHYYNDRQLFCTKHTAQYLIFSNCFFTSKTEAYLF